MSAFGLARQLGIGRTQAQQYVDLYFARYPGVKKYMDDTREQARSRGYVETVAGRRLYLPDIGSRNRNLQQYAERSAINAPMQGTAADIIKRAMIDVDAWCQAGKLTKARLIMQVHDELVLEVRTDAVAEVSDEVRDAHGGRGRDLRVPLKVDIGTGDQLGRSALNCGRNCASLCAMTLMWRGRHSYDCGSDGRCANRLVNRYLAVRPTYTGVPQVLPASLPERVECLAQSRPVPGVSDPGGRKVAGVFFSASIAADARGPQSSQRRPATKTAARSPPYLTCVAPRRAPRAPRFA